MNRKDFQRLAKARAEEARALLAAGHFPGAYYLGGYVVECALKACIARQTRQHDFPPERRDLEDIYTHDPTRLLRAAGLETVFKQEAAADPDFKLNWAVVKEWKETSRYQVPTEQEARELLDATFDRRHGVLRWLKRFW